MSFEEFLKFCDPYVNLFAPAQIAILEDMFNQIFMKKKNASKIHVLCALPGAGKSTFIRAACCYCIEHHITLLLLTDRCNRLSENLELVTEKYPQRVINLSPNEKDEMQAIDYSYVKSKSIVALTVQKYNIMPQKTRNILLEFENGAKDREKSVTFKRDLCIIDEAPIDFEIKRIGLKDISGYKGILHDAIEDEIDKNRAYELMGIVEKDIKKYFDEFAIGDEKVKLDLFIDPVINSEKIELLTNSLKQFLNNKKYQLSKIRFPKEEADICLAADAHGCIRVENTEQEISEAVGIFNDAVLKINKLDHAIALVDGMEVGANYFGNEKIELIKTETKDIFTDLQFDEWLLQIQACLEKGKPLAAISEIEKIVTKHLPEIKRMEIISDFEVIKNVYVGKTIISRGNEKSGSGTRYLLTALDHKCKLPESIPTYIMDGTGDIDERYCDADNFDIKKYVRDIPPVVQMEIHNEQCSKTSLANINYKEKFFTEICDMLHNTNYLNPEQTMLSGFKQTEEDLNNLAVSGISAYPAATYGNITGLNVYRNCDKLIKFGTGRMDNVTAYLISACRHPKIWNELKEKNVKERMEILNRILAFCDNPFKEYIESTQLSRMIVDAVQEIYRLKIRKWPVDDTTYNAVKVMMFLAVRPREVREDDESSLSEKFVDGLVGYFESSHVTYISRKINADCSDLMIQYIDALPDETWFTISDIAKAIDQKVDTIKHAIARDERLKGKLELLNYEAKRGRKAARWQKGVMRTAVEGKKV